MFQVKRLHSVGEYTDMHSGNTSALLKEPSNNFVQRLSDAMPQWNINSEVTHMPNSYFDFNATGPVRPEVIDAMNRAMVDPGKRLLLFILLEEGLEHLSIMLVRTLPSLWALSLGG